MSDLNDALICMRWVEVRCPKGLLIYRTENGAQRPGLGSEAAALLGSYINNRLPIQMGRGRFTLDNLDYACKQLLKSGELKLIDQVKTENPEPKDDYVGGRRNHAVSSKPEVSGMASEINRMNVELRKKRPEPTPEASVGKRIIPLDADADLLKYGPDGKGWEASELNFYLQRKKQSGYRK